MKHALEQLFRSVDIPMTVCADVIDDLMILIDEVRGFWTADWTDWREMCRFIAERLEHYAKRFRQHAEVE